MFFFIRPKFKIDGFWVSHIPLSVLFFFFPFGYLVLNEEFPELEDGYWDED